MEDDELYLYHHYLQKGITPEQIDNLDYLTKQFYAASMDIELSKQNEKEELRAKLLKDEKAYPTVTF